MLFVVMLAGLTIATPPAHAGAAPQHVRTVARVDLARYAGDWFETARFQNRFQQKCAGDVRASYARRPDGRIDVINRCRLADGSIDEARGVARVVDEQTSAKLKVRFAPAVLSFLPFVWGDYWVIGLADDYSWAVVGSPDRQYLWILGRRPELSKGALSEAFAAARANGFDVDRLRMTPQTPPSRDARNASRE
ncbi:MAG: lipocalin family protein [Acidobacteriota bacterium]|nr:lipocalin family protein [Acidobacteriota bacterium]